MKLRQLLTSLVLVTGLAANSFAYAAKPYCQANKTFGSGHFEVEATVSYQESYSSGIIGDISFFVSGDQNTNNGYRYLGLDPSVRYRQFYNESLDEITSSNFSLKAYVIHPGEPFNLRVYGSAEDLYNVVSAKNWEFSPYNGIHVRFEGWLEEDALAARNIMLAGGEFRLRIEPKSGGVIDGPFIRFTDFERAYNWSTATLSKLKNNARRGQCTTEEPYDDDDGM